MSAFQKIFRWEKLVSQPFQNESQTKLNNYCSICNINDGTLLFNVTTSKLFEIPTWMSIPTWIIFGTLEFINVGIKEEIQRRKEEGSWEVSETYVWDSRWWTKRWKGMDLVEGFNWFLNYDWRKYFIFKLIRKIVYIY